MPRPGGLLAVGSALFLIIAFPSVIRFYTNWLWFSEVGFQSVYLTALRAQGSVFAVTFALTALWMTVNLRAAVHAVGDIRPIFTTRDGLQVTLPGRRQVQSLIPFVTLAVALLVGLFASSEWEMWLAWRNAVPFGEADPILNRDVGFYVFSLPALQRLQGLGQLLIVLAAITSGALYFVSGSLTTGFPARFILTPSARRHLSLLAAAFLLLIAFGAWLGRAALLLEPSTLFTGASYADVHARMPAALVAVAAAILGAALAVWQAFSARNWPIPLAAGLYLVVTVGGQVYSGTLQRFVVTPNEQVREGPFIQHNIDATRRAFGLDTVEAAELSGDALLTREDIARNAPTLDNVRLWDHQPLLDTFGQIQEIRTYYDFVSVDNDRYLLNGQNRQVMLSARELNSASLPNRTWVNERMTFTHGYGLTLGPVNEVTSEGLPVLFVRNLPPETIPELQISEPSIYFGELSNDYVIVKTNTREFHYPRGDDNVFTTYAGQGGVSLGSLFRKLLFAVRFGAYQIVLSDDIGPESRILFHRNIRERVAEIAPFLTYDRDPYLVIADGRLFWLYDAYTISGRYPYSTSAVGGVNYIRNAVKIAIDAYNGTTTFYLADPTDPIAATYARIFPTLFRPMAEMMPSLRAHLRYPEDIFGIQAAVYATYHMTQPDVFYNREDQWEVPTVDQEQNAAAMQPYYTIMRLPGEQDAEFIQMLPFTPRRKDNLAAWLVARSDGEHYGKLGVFQFPKQKVIFGPRQVVARISQDQQISPQITLWNQQGSQIIWGTLMVIPIEESLIYVRPLYLRASGGRIPELTRVIVVYQNQIVMERTLDDGLARLFGGASPSSGGETDNAAPPLSTSAPSETPAPPSRLPNQGAAVDGLASEARQHYERAIEAQRAGDWSRYGDEIRLLGETLTRMQQRR
jgi:uncharacterized membrane protein (UPF0182 family)